MATAVIAMMATGATMGAWGSYREGLAGQQAGLYQAAVARNNAIISEQNAKLEEAKGRVLEDTSRQQTAQMIGSERAGFGASGVDPNTGTANRVQGDTAMVGEQNALTIRSNAARSAYNYRVQGVNFEASAKMDEMSAANALQAGKIGAITSLVSGGSQTGAKYQEYKTSGAIA